MALLKKSCERIILIIITISILIMFLATPSSYAKLDLKDGEFYYAGTTKGSYTVKEGIFSWLLDNIGQIADWLIGIMTMGFRMVFVGWTALIEKLLTWGLETTVGINVEGENVDGLSSTDLTSITDSSNNLTVQAIVYNRVPAFDINFFESTDEYDKTVSGTGKILRCEKCGKKVSECCTSPNDCCTECGGKCESCKRYIEALKNAEDPDGVKPITIQLKEIIATWYYILRMLSMAVMLVVLIGVGIKMAVSTIASEKAVYKRMLVDWVVGAILIFSIHYLMIFIININDSLINIIVEAANDVNSVQMRQLSEKQKEPGKIEGVEKDNEEIEIDIYEAVRTRAYDPKLTNGLSGMLMYMTLVYFAIRYTIVYIKRYLTLIVLTLMGPPVGVAYALQKALTGKSSTLKTWMTEYTMNVIIQSVHAIIYGVFISTALILSLQSIAGIIIALILMNYSLKAEALFRKIFKFGDGDSLLGHTAEAGNAEKMKQNLDAAVGLYAGAKPLAGALLNSPYGKAVKGVGKVALGTGVLATAGIAKVGKNIKNSLTDSTTEESQTANNGAAQQDNSSGGNTETKGKATEGKEQAGGTTDQSNGTPGQAGAELNSEESIKSLLAKGETKLRGEVESSLNEIAQTKEGTPERAKAEQKYNTAMSNYRAYKDLETPSTKNIAKGHGDDLLDVTNHFNFSKNSKGSYLSLDNLNKLRKGVMGGKHKDFKTGKMVSDGTGLYSRFSSANLLGFTDADKKVFKEQVLTPIKNGLGGMAMMFVGAGTLVAHPTMGLGLLASGRALKNKTLKKKPNNKKYKGRYGFSRFSTPAMIDVQKAALARSRREMDKYITDNVKSTNPDFYNRLKKEIKNDNKVGFGSDVKNAAKSTVAVGTMGAIAGGGVAATPLLAVGTAGLLARKFKDVTAIGDNMDAINKHSIKQMREQQEKFIKDGMSFQSQLEIATGESKKQEHDQEFEKETLEELNSKETQKELDLYVQTMIDLYAQQGKIYDPVTGLVRDKEGSEAKSVEGIKKEDITIKNIKTGKTRTLTDADINNINKELTEAMDTILAAGGESDKKGDQDEVIKLVNAKLQKAGILNKNESVENVIRGGESTIVSALKRKDEFNKTKNEAISKATLGNLEEKDREKITEAYEKLSNKKTNITAQDILNTMNDGSKSADSSKDGSSKLEASKGNIENYINAIQISDMITPKKSDRKKQVDVALEIKKKRRAEKLNDILNLNLGNIETTDDALNAINNGKDLQYTSGENVKLTQNDTSEIVEMLLMRKELESINEFTKKELELKKASSSYNKAVKNKSSKAVAYYSSQLEIERFKQANADLYDGDKVKEGTELDKAIEARRQANDSRKEISPERVKGKLNRIKDLEGKLDQKELDMRKAERNITSKGPTVDITKLINEIYSKK